MIWIFYIIQNSVKLFAMHICHNNTKLLSQESLKTTMHNRSVYVIGFPHRENLLAKEDS